MRPLIRLNGAREASTESIEKKPLLMRKFEGKNVQKPRRADWLELFCRLLFKVCDGFIDPLGI